eukprot:scaffold13983_cov125-Isochrysis_galbana.AAC.8
MGGCGTQNGADDGRGVGSQRTAAKRKGQSDKRHAAQGERDAIGYRGWGKCDGIAAQHTTHRGELRGCAAQRGVRPWPGVCPISSKGVRFQP